MSDGQDVPKPSFKGLTKGGRTILKHFRGTLIGCPGKTEYNNVQYYFQFVNLQVLATDGDQPYLFPNAEIKVKYSNREESSWGHLGDSVTLAMGLKSREEIDFDKLVGKIQEWTRVDDVPYGKDKDGKPMMGTDWKVNFIEGYTPVPGGAATPGVAGGANIAPILSPVQVALSLLDGKTAIDFWKAALTNDTIKKDAALGSSILDNTFVESLKAAGKVTVDAAGIHHVAK